MSLGREYRFDDPRMDRFASSILDFLNEQQGSLLSPGGPQNLSVTVTDSGAEGVFDRVDDLGVSEYFIYRGTTKNFTVDTTELIESRSQPDEDQSQIHFFDSFGKSGDYYWVRAVKGLQRPKLLGDLSFAKATAASGVTSDGSLFSNYLDLAEISDPGAPSPNYIRLHAEDEGGFTVLQHKDSTGLDFEIGRDSYHVARNTTGAKLDKGTVVYISGSTGIYPEVSKARADSSTTLPAIGMLVEDIENNSFGRVLQVGDLEGVDTSSFLDGDVVYVSDSTAGALTATKPGGSSLAQRVGVVIKSSVGAGIIAIDLGTPIGSSVGLTAEAGSGDVLRTDGTSTLTGAREVSGLWDFTSGVLKVSDSAPGSSPYIELENGDGQIWRMGIDGSSLGDPFVLVDGTLGGSRMHVISGGAFFVYSDFNPNVTATHDLGASSARWGTLYATSIDATGTGQFDGLLTANSGINVTGNVDIQSGALITDTIYSTGVQVQVQDDLDVTGTLSVTGQTTLDDALNVDTIRANLAAFLLLDENTQVAGSLAPSINLNYDLGTSSLRWATLFVDDIQVRDNSWIGLGAAAGRIEFDDLVTDEVNILGANVGIGTSTPGYKLEVAGTGQFSGLLTASSGLNVTGNVDVTGALITDTIYSNGVQVQVQDDLDVTGTLSVTGQTTLDDFLNVDTIRANLAAFLLLDENTQVAGSLAPSINLNYDLGTSSLYWASAYIDDLRVSSQAIIGDGFAISTHGVLGVKDNTGPSAPDITGTTANMVFSSDTGRRLNIGWHGGIAHIAATSNSVLALNQLGGRVGIGTDSPAQTLEVSGSALVEDILYLGTSGSSSYLDTSAYAAIYTSIGPSGSYPFNEYGNLIIQPRTGGTPRDILFATELGGIVDARMVIKSAGNVGIGASTPGYKLEVAGTGQFSGLLTASAGLNVTGNVDVSGALITDTIYSNGVQVQIQDDLDVTGTLSVTGQTTLDDALNVDTIRANLAAFLLLDENTQVAGSLAPSINLNYDLGTSSLHWATLFVDDIQVRDNSWIGLGAAAGRIEFDDLVTDEVNILGANVGIGTSGPSYKLDVSGTGRFSGLLTASAGLNVTGNVDISGTLTVDTIDHSGAGDVTISDSLALGGTLYPSLGSTYDLGTAVARWSRLYVDRLDANGGGIIVDENVDINGDLTLRSTDDLFVSSIEPGSQLSIGGAVQISGALSPSLGGSYDLGTSSLYWQTGYFDTLEFDELECSGSPFGFDAGKGLFLQDNLGTQWGAMGVAGVGVYAGFEAGVQSGQSGIISLRRKSTATTKPGQIWLENANGVRYYLYINTSGTLIVTTTAP